MELRTFLLIFLALCPAFSAQTDEDIELMIDASVKVSQTDANYICATIDWWPKEKCDYKQCPWGLASIVNLDLSHPTLENAMRAFKGLRLRLGGSLQDQVIYDIGSLKTPCHPFTKQKGGLFGFSKGCLHMKRWDELNNFFKKTGALVTFGLNALYGRRQGKRHAWGGNWDSSNARNFMKYTVSKGYQIHSWELGNELSGNGIGASVNAVQYGKDVIKLHNLVGQVYNKSQEHPLLLAPGGFYDPAWFSKFLKVSGHGIVNALTHHIYNLGPGSDGSKLVGKILNPQRLDGISTTFNSLSQTIKMNGPWASAWVGESGGAYNSGGLNVSNTFVDSFWYLDQLGMAAKYNTKVYCRQTLIGGNYGLLDTSTFVPNPDYYSALLWHTLMGKEVLDVSSNSSPYLRSYAHCTKNRAGVTLLLINLSDEIQYGVTIQSSAYTSLQASEKRNHKTSSFVRGLKESVSWVGSKSSDVTLSREEYHLTPNGGNIQSRTMLLNGKPLQLTETGDIPSFSPVHKNIKSPLSIAPLSIKFIVLPNFNSPSCR